MKKYILLLFLPIIAFANIGKITAIKGDISIQRETRIIVATIGFNLERYDFIITKKNSKVQIVFVDKTIFTIGQNSTLDIAEYLYNEKQPSKNKAQFNVLRGSFSSITGRIGKLNRTNFKLKTKSASIGIRGTIVKANQEVVMCTQGAISVTTPNGTTVEVKAGEKTDVSSGTPTPPAVIKKGEIKALESKKEKGTLSNTIKNIQDNSNTLDNLRNASSTVNAQYSGQVSGTTTTGGNILENSNNAVKINFALGGGQNTMDGTIKFDTVGSQTWDTEFSGTTSGNTFSSTNIDRTTVTTSNSQSSVDNGSGNVGGSFYGANQESISGNFNLAAPNSNDGTATGTFEATK